MMLVDAEIYTIVSGTYTILDRVEEDDNGPTRGQLRIGIHFPSGTIVICTFSGSLMILHTEHEGHMEHVIRLMLTQVKHSLTRPSTSVHSKRCFAEASCTPRLQRTLSARFGM